MGTSEEFAVDILVNALLTVSKECAPVDGPPWVLLLLLVQAGA